MPLAKEFVCLTKRNHKVCAKGLHANILMTNAGIVVNVPAKAWIVVNVPAKAWIVVDVSVLCAKKAGIEMLVVDSLWVKPSSHDVLGFGLLCISCDVYYSRGYAQNISKKNIYVNKNKIKKSILGFV